VAFSEELMKIEFILTTAKHKLH